MSILDNLPTEFWSAGFGAVLGAGVAGAIAYLLQRQTLREAARLRDEEEKKRKEALSHSLVLKLLKMHSNIANYRDHIEELYQRNASKGGTEEHPWRFVTPIANHPEPNNFSIEEIALVLSFKDMDLANDLMPLDNVHNAVIKSFQKFCEKSEALRSQLPATMTSEGLVTLISKEDEAYLLPKMIEVDSLIVQLREWTERDATFFWEITTKVCALVEKHVGMKIDVELKKSAISK